MVLNRTHWTLNWTLHTINSQNIAVYSHENFAPPACKSREDARPQVPGRVDSVATVEAHGQADDQHHQAHSECLQISGDWIVVGVDDGQDAQYQRRCSNHLEYSSVSRVRLLVHISFFDFLII